MTRRETVLVHAARADDGRHLDHVLADRIAGLSRQRARDLLDRGAVVVDGRHTRSPQRLVRAGQRIEARLGRALGAAIRAEPAADPRARPAPVTTAPTMSILHEDDDLIVVDKPAGLLTATSAGSSRPSAHDLLSARRADTPRLYVVQRLDLATSGVLVFAKGEAANRALARAFRDHATGREYLAVVRGPFPEGTTTLTTAVKGKRAITHVSLVERLGRAASVVRCRLDTGRTHQIRVHVRRAGHWILGDPRHGQRTALDPPRLALHAERLALAHPRTGERLSFSSPWPADLAAWLDGLRAPVLR